jgi:hypothetical protein
MLVYVPERVRQASREVTGGADSHYKTNQSVGIGKGSVQFREVALKGLDAVLVVGGSVVRQRHGSRKTTE